VRWLEPSVGAIHELPLPMVSHLKSAMLRIDLALGGGHRELDDLDLFENRAVDEFN
jgi:hypothetical protein